MSEKWFWFNFLPLIITILLCHLKGVPVYFGPQQYGPETRWQRRLARWTISWFVKEVRVRNRECLALLGLPNSALLYDEVFSCISRYPVSQNNPRKFSFILINMRGSRDFVDSKESVLSPFASLLNALQERLELPFKLFQMSGPSFSDDSYITEYLRKEGFASVQLEVLPQFKDEKEIIKIMGQAYGTLSMSFHGCIMSMIAGCPAVPIISGQYYDYKYADFNRYTGNQGVPVVNLSSLNVEQAADEICSYIANYQLSLTVTARENAGMVIEEWYQLIGNNERHN